MTTGKVILLLILFPIIGVVIAWNYTLLDLDGRFVQWKSIPGLPDKAVKIVAVTEVGVWVETESGAIYENDYDSAPVCQDPCWRVSSLPSAQSLPTHPTYIFEPGDCGELPTRPESVDLQALCSLEGIGNYIVVYSADKDGAVYSWEHGHGEWDALALLLYPCYGSIFGLIVAVLVIVVGKTMKPTPATLRRSTETDTESKDSSD